MTHLTSKPLASSAIRDVGAPQRVRRRGRERRQSALLLARARRDSRLAQDLADALARDPTATQVGERVGVGAGRLAGRAQSRKVLGEPINEIGGHLHLADPGLGLGVGDAEAPAVAVVEPELADAQVAQLADAHAAAPDVSTIARRPE
jgi:hypothetical protein